jgi:cytochrome P450
MTSPIEAVTQPDPYPYYAQLVAERPLHFDPVLQLWVASSADAVTAVLSQPAVRVRPPSEPVPGAIVGTAAGDVFGSLVRMTDGALSRRLKEIVSDALGSVDPRRTMTTAARCAGASLRSGAEPDFADLMFRVPSQVIASLCGLDDGLDEEAATLAADFVYCLSAAATPEQLAASARAAERLQTLMKPSGESTGLLDELVQAARRADWHESGPLIANAVGFLSQTYDAVAGLIGNTLLSAARRSVDLNGSEGLDALGSIVREVARHDAPVQNTRRFAAEDFQIGDTEILAGQGILVLLAAANRDPAANPEPHAFRADRPDPRLFTFGLGVHGCPGMELAVSIATAVVAEVLDSGVAAVDGSPAYRPAPNVRIPVL